MIRRLLIALVLVGMSAQAHASSNGILTQGLSSSTSSSITLTTTGSSGAAVLSGSNLNIPVYSGAGEVTNGDSALNITSTTNMAATSAVFSAARTWTLPGASTVAAGQRVCVSDQVGAVSTSFPLTIAASGTDTY
jgi:hypothetical protein